LFLQPVRWRFLDEYGSASQLAKSSASSTAAATAAPRNSLRNPLRKRGRCANVREIRAWMVTIAAPGVNAPIASIGHRNWFYEKADCVARY